MEKNQNKTRGATDLNGVPLDYLVESWALTEADARSTVVFRTDTLGSIGDEDLTELAGTCLEESRRAVAEGVERSENFTFVNFRGS